MTVVEIDTTIQRHVDAAGHEFGPLARYQNDPTFGGEITPIPLTHRVRGRLGRARRRLLG